MARIVLDSMLVSISGKLGDDIYRRNRDGTVSICRKPRLDPHRLPTSAQAECRARFKAATAQYRLLRRDPEKLAAYRFLLKRRGSLSRLHAVIIADILRPPTITALDLGAYHGRPGEPIRVTATESVAVACLSLSILDLDTRRLIETAEKSFSGTDLAPAVSWRYTTTVNIPAGHKARVTATAFDLAGNQVEVSQFITNAPLGNSKPLSPAILHPARFPVSQPRPRRPVCAIILTGGAAHSPGTLAGTSHPATLRGTAGGP